MALTDLTAISPLERLLPYIIYMSKLKIRQAEFGEK